jgi:hypothetical protein
VHYGAALVDDEAVHAVLDGEAIIDDEMRDEVRCLVRGVHYGAALVDGEVVHAVPDGEALVGDGVQHVVVMAGLLVGRCVSGRGNGCRGTG